MTDIKLFSDNSSLSTPVSELSLMIKQKVMEGEVSAIDVGILLKKMSKLSDECFEDKAFKETIQTETKKAFDGKTCTKYGAVISERATSTWYDFSVCNDPIWTALDTIQKELKELIKAREEDLKSLIPKTEKLTFGIANTDTKQIIAAMPKLIWEDGNGEEVTIKPPHKYQSVGLVYSKL